MLLSFREDEQKENCPCPTAIQHLLQDFHHLLNTHCGGSAAESFTAKNYTLVFIRQGIYKSFVKVLSVIAFEITKSYFADIVQVLSSTQSQRMKMMLGRLLKINLSVL